MDIFIEFMKTNIKLSCIGCSFVMATLFFHGYTQFLMIIWSFLGGIVFSYFVFGPDTLLPNLLIFITRKKRDRRKDDDEFSLLKKICPVCGDKKCPRHRPELNILALQPWTNLTLPEKVDEALEEFLNLVLKNYVYTWYREISEDEAFIDEIRSSIRFGISILFRRIKKVDLPHFILDKLVRYGVRHFDTFLEAMKNKGDQTDLQQAALDAYGPHLHIAMRSRASELEYLRSMINSLFPFLLPNHSLKCRSLCALMQEIISGSILLPVLDVLADPDILNKLLLVVFDKTPPPVCTDPPSPEVTILSNFSVPLSKNCSSLHMESVSDILHNQEALYPFMQFLKSEASVNVLMFCLAAEEFNNQILNPDLTDDELSNLHSKAKEIYETYCSPTAPDKIQFDDEIIIEIREIISGQVENIKQLQKTTALFRAYEHAYNLLETTFLPLFYQSDDYYIWLCGNRHSSNLFRIPSLRGRKANENFSLSKFGSKLKGVFKSNTVEGKVAEDILTGADEAEDLLATNTDDMIFGSFLDEHSPQSPLHDLSSWRVSIPDVAPFSEPDNIKKSYNAFVIEVRRLDVLEADEYNPSKWVVIRRYNEFYVLEQKLKEFHGEFPDSRLPPKKALGTKGMEFLESKRVQFEHYLQTLLTMPRLKGSELLFNFLTSDDQMTSSFLPDNIGKVIKSVPMKLVKERGQNLEPFLASFLSSVEIAKPRAGRQDDKESDTVSISSENLANPMYENNANVDSNAIPPTPDQSPNMPVAPQDVYGIYDTLMFTADHLYTVSTSIRKLLMTGRIIFRSTVDHFVDWYLGQKIDQVSQEHRVISIIHLLRDVLFFDDDPPRTDQEKFLRKEETLEELMAFVPRLFVTGIGKEKFEEGTSLLFSALQMPKLNKQLTYVYLDLVLAELFPELVEWTEYRDFSPSIIR